MGAINAKYHAFGNFWPLTDLGDAAQSDAQPGAAFGLQLYSLILDAPMALSPEDTAGRGSARPVGIGHFAPLTANDSWKSAVSGDWATANDWSTGEPTVSTAATISVSGTYTVTIDSAVTALSLTVSNANATIADTSGGTLTLTKMLSLTAGTFSLGSGSSIVGGTISVAGGSFSASGGRLSDVTYEGTLTLGASNPLATGNLALINGITLTGAGGTGAGAINLSGTYGGDLDIESPMTLNNATIDVGATYGASNLFFEDVSGTGGATTLGPQLDITQTDKFFSIDDIYDHAGDSLINKGTISAGLSGGNLSIRGGETFTNQGSILASNGEIVFIEQTALSNSGLMEASGGAFLSISSYDGLTFTNAGKLLVTTGGTLSVDPTGVWSNGGSIVENGGTLNLGGTFTPATLDSVTRTGGAINIIGTLSNAGSTLSIGTGSALGDIGLSGTTSLADIYTGTIAGGVIKDAGGGLTSGSGGTLSGLTYEGTLTLGASTQAATGSLTFINGITLLGAGGTGPTTINLAGKYDGLLNVASPMTLNNATIDIGSNYSALDLSFYNRSTTDGAITLGAQLDITQTGLSADIVSSYRLAGDGLVNKGIISAGFANGYFRIGGSNSFTNQGSLLVSSGEHAHISQYSINNTGLMEASGGAYLILSTYNRQAFTNTGKLLVTTGGTLSIAPGGIWSNGGSIVENDGTLDLGGTFTTETLASVSEAGGTLNVTGTLSNTGATLSIGTGTTLGNIGLFGTISGGIIQDAGGGLDAVQGTLSGVTYEGTLTLGASAAAAAGNLTLTNGITLTGAGGTGAATINLSGMYGGNLNVISPMTLNNATIDIGSSYYQLGIRFQNQSGTGGATILGAQLDITQTGMDAKISGDYNFAGDGLINKGIISAGVDGGYLRLSGSDTFTNQGSLLASNGEPVYVSLYSINNAGLMEATGGAGLYVSTSIGGTFTNTGTLLVTTGGTLSISPAGIWSNGGSIVENDATLNLGGTFTTATLASFSVTGGTVNVAGTLNNKGATLSIGTATALGDIGLSGTIVGGTIQDSGGGLMCERGTLSGVTYEGTVTLGASTGAALGDLTLTNGITLSGAGGTGAATVNLSGVYGGNFSVASPMTLNNATIDVGSHYVTGGLYFVNRSGVGGATILGPQLNVTQTGNDTAARIFNDYQFAGDSLINKGVISGSAGVYLKLVGSGIFTNQGSFLAGNGDIVEIKQSSISNSGLIESASGAQLSIYAYSDQNFTNTGSIVVQSGSALLVVEGNFTNSGTISVSGASTATIQPTIFKNLSGATLSGGIFNVGAGSTLVLANNVTISTDRASITLSGAGSNIEALNSTTGTQVTLDSRLSSIGTGGTLSLLNGRNFKAVADNGTFTTTGLLNLGGVAFTATSLAIGTGGSLSGYGTVAGVVSDAGSIGASGGTLTLSGALTGAGGLAAASGATIDLTQGGGLTEAISGSGTLKLDGTTAYTLAAGTSVGIAALQIDAGSTLSGVGTLAGALSDAGMLSATGGTLTVEGAASEAGLLSVAASTTLDLAGGGSLSGTIFGAGTLRLDGTNPLTLQSGAALSAAAVLVDAGASLVLDTAGSSIGSISGAGALQLAGATTYSFAGGTDTIGALAVLAGATLSASGTLTGSVNDAGILTATTGVLDLTGGGTLSGTVNGSGTLQLDGTTYTLHGATISASSLAVDSSATLSGTGSIANTVTDTGTISASGGVLGIAGALSGAGALITVSGATLDLSGGGSLTEAVSGAGTLQLDSAAFTLPGGNLTIANLAVDQGAALSGFGSITGALTDAGAITASGGTLVLAAVSGAGTLSAANGATLDLTAGGILSEQVTGAGTLQLDGGTYTLTSAVSAGTALVDAGAALSGPGTLDGALVNNGAAYAATGTLAVDGAVSGTGSFIAGGGATLDLAGGGSLAGSFSGAGTLQLDGTTAFTIAAAEQLLVGTVKVDSGATLSGAGTIANALVDNGSVSVGASGTLVAFGAVSGSGALSAGSGGLIDLKAGGALSTLISGAGMLELEGATAFALAAQSVTIGTVAVASGASLSGFGSITGALIDNGTVTASGGVLTLGNAISGTGVLQAAAGGVLDLTAGGPLNQSTSGSGTLELTGSYQLGTGALSVAALAIDAGSSLSGTGTLGNRIADSGLLGVAGGTLTLTGAVTGSGTLSAASGAVLDLTAGGTLAEATSGAGTLKLDGTTAYTLAGAQSFAIGTLAVDAGVALSGSGTIASALTNSGTVTASDGRLVLAGSITGTGSLQAAANAVLDLTAGGSLAKAISGAGTLELGGAYTLGTKLPTVANVQIDAAGSLTGAGDLTAAVADSGLVQALGGTLTLAGAVSGSGTLSAGAGAVLALTKASSFAGALTGAGTLKIGGAVTLAAGASLSAITVIETANLTLGAHASLTNGAGDSFAITAATGRTVELGGATTDSFTNAGTLVGNGAGTAELGTAFVNSGDVVASSGKLAFLGTVTNTGTIDASAGTLAISTSVGGTGTLEVGATGTLSLLHGAATGQTVDFLAGTGLLDLTRPVDFKGVIDGFGASDQIDLLKTAETNFTFANGVLTVKNGTTTEATLHFGGTYTMNDFIVASDQHGGTLITFS